MHGNYETETDSAITKNRASPYSPESQVCGGGRAHVPVSGSLNCIRASLQNRS